MPARPPVAHWLAAASSRRAAQLSAPGRLWCAAQRRLEARQVLLPQLVALQALTCRKASGRSAVRRLQAALWRMAPAGPSLAQGSRPCPPSFHVEQEEALEHEPATMSLPELHVLPVLFRRRGLRQR